MTCITGVETHPAVGTEGRGSEPKVRHPKVESKGRGRENKQERTQEGSVEKAAKKWLQNSAAANAMRPPQEVETKRARHRQRTRAPKRGDKPPGGGEVPRMSAYDVPPLGLLGANKWRQLRRSQPMNCELGFGRDVEVHKCCAGMRKLYNIHPNSLLKTLPARHLPSGKSHIDTAPRQQKLKFYSARSRYEQSSNAAPPHSPLHNSAYNHFHAPRVSGPVAAAELMPPSMPITGAAAARGNAAAPFVGRMTLER
ncbi:unnamed protein product [Prorocentrum cordatum]|uniref:Uncharacterized protein n=2 Tax=Prorocentrum cordatum TaxID=2364126 RepID=A0ABN9RAB2_9DINO|nr:unnamed protein product [Polarella glacialis]